MPRRKILEQWKVDDLNDGATAIALVGKPAIKQNFTKLFTEHEHLQDLPDDENFVLDFIKYLEETSVVKVEPDQDELDRLVGDNLIATPLFVADRPIRRQGIDYDALAQMDPGLSIEEKEAYVKEYVLYFFYAIISEDDTRKMAQNFISLGRQGKWNLAHNQDAYVDGISLVESWTVGNAYNDKSNSFGWILNPGSWFGLVSIDNEEVRQQYIDTGILPGVSLELRNTREETLFSDESLELVNNIIKNQ